MTAERTAGAKRYSMLGWLPGESLRRAQLDERVEWELRSALVRQLVHEKAFAEAARIILAVVLGGVVLNDLGLRGSSGTAVSKRGWTVTFRSRSGHKNSSPSWRMAWNRQTRCSGSRVGSSRGPG